MKYRNATELLPPQLLQELQQYAQGETLYVPRVKRKSWGEGTGAKSFYLQRDMDIKSRFKQGDNIEKLGDEFFISEDAVKKIVYKKGDIDMRANEIDYSKYFWQDELIRVRRSRPEDWKLNGAPGYDSEERFFSDYGQELPNDEESRKDIWENYVKANWNSDDRILLAFETHDGKYVGGGNLHAINERNGTFGMFVGASEERYAIAGAKLMLNYAFNELRLNNCHTGFIENDYIYQPIFVKLGFTLEGTRRQQVFHNGKYWNENLYGLLAEEFNAKG
ncbi:MAG: GNAT family N-acetyltransferase [Defluviitaleaceae bacterium]|nr:GNAT family N-acetyltransferase [Defluviitaleaceae bacterium]